MRYKMPLSIACGFAVFRHMFSLKPILALIFAVLLIATSGAMASARGMAQDATGQMVLCTGAGVTAVLMDAEGQPLGALHYCPDCALSSLAVLDADQLNVTPSPTVITQRFPVTSWAFKARSGTSFSARDPPQL
jgi:hypothetical protein